MRNFSKAFLFIIILIPGLGHTQASGLDDPSASFIAIIVKDMERSIDWYGDILGFEVLDKTEVSEMGFKQANLKRGQIKIELIELSSALDPVEAIPNYNQKTKLQGFFKFGMDVKQLDPWVDHLRENGVTFSGNVVTDQKTGMRMFIVLDPDGNRIQFFEKK